tara:strand:+ start:52 stop:966 length:915 start_codon:yes stop_codon:yes gene_type:complete
MAYAWRERWVEKLSEKDATEKLTKELVDHWQRNARGTGPLFLSAPYDKLGQWCWEDYLEGFLLSEDLPEIAECAQTIIKAFERATEQSQPDDQHGLVWFYGTLALRRAQFADDTHRVIVARLLLRAVGIIVGKYPEPTMEAYNFVGCFYSAIKKCIYSELYEKRIISVMYAGGFTACTFEDYSLFRQLEAERKNESFTDASALGIGIAYQQVLDDLFETLFSLSSFIYVNEPVQEEAFEQELYLFQRDPERVEEKERFLGFQRWLDRDWSSLCRLVSPTKQEKAALVQNFISVIGAYEERQKAG